MGDVEETLRNVFAEKSGDDGMPAFTYTEFLAATFDRKYATNDSLLAEAFNSFDKDGDGNISVDEVKSGKLLGVLTSDEVSQLFVELDLNGDSLISFEEFKIMMKADMKVDTEPTS